MNESLGTLTAGASLSRDGTYSITQADLNNNTLTNIAFAAGNDMDGNPVSSSGEETITVGQSTGLSVTRTASPQTYSKEDETIAEHLENKRTEFFVLDF